MKCRANNKKERQERLQEIVRLKKHVKARIFEASFWWPVSLLYWSRFIDSCESGQMSRRESEKGEKKRKTSKKEFLNHNR